MYLKKILNYMRRRTRTNSIENIIQLNKHCRRTHSTYNGRGGRNRNNAAFFHNVSRGGGAAALHIFKRVTRRRRRTLSMERRK